MIWILVKHDYKRGRTDLRSDLLAGIQIKPWRENKEDDYILIFEQIRPEWSEKIIDRMRWEKWLKDLEDTYQVLIPYANNNFNRWKILGEEIWPNPSHIVAANTYEKQYTLLRDYIEKRAAWLVSNLNQL